MEAEQCVFCRLQYQWMTAFTHGSYKTCLTLAMWNSRNRQLNRCHSGKRLRGCLNQDRNFYDLWCSSNLNTAKCFGRISSRSRETSRISWALVPSLIYFIYKCICLFFFMNVFYNTKSNVWHFTRFSHILIHFYLYKNVTRFYTIVVHPPWFFFFLLNYPLN